VSVFSFKMSDNGGRYMDNTPEMDEHRDGNGVKLEAENGNGDYEDGPPTPRKGRTRRRSTSGSIKDRSRSRSRSKSGSKSRHLKKRKSHRQSRSRSPDPRRSSRSHKKRSRSRSRSHDLDRRRQHSRSPSYGKPKARDAPTASRCLGVFGMSIYTDEKQLEHYFSQFGAIEAIQIVYDRKTRRSRGFAFIYFERMDDAITAKERAVGTEIDGQRVRIDFSITNGPHAPTPGMYMGRRREGREDREYGRSYGGPPPVRRRRSRSYSR